MVSKNKADGEEENEEGAGEEEDRENVAGEGEKDYDDSENEEKIEDGAGDGEQEKEDSPSETSVSLSDYQAILSIVEDIEKDLECPVCLNIPREVPIPSCPAGHIVCKTCKPKVKECPTCKREYPWGKFEVTSSLAGSLIDKVPQDVNIRISNVTSRRSSVKLLIMNRFVRRELSFVRSLGVTKKSN